MKQVFLSVLLMIVCFVAGAQKNKKPVKLTEEQIEKAINEIPVQDGKIWYEGVVEVDSSMKKDEIYYKLRQWFIEYFKSSKDVLELDDKEQGVMMGKGAHKVLIVNGLNAHEGYVNFVLNTAVKDGKFKYQIYDFQFQGYNSSALSSTARPMRESIDLSNALNDYKAGKRKKLNRKFLEDMAALHLTFKESMNKHVVERKSLTDF